MPIPVIHMPPGLELGPVPPLPRSHFGLPENRFLFLFMFDMSSVMERKNPLGLIRAYRKPLAVMNARSWSSRSPRGPPHPANLARLLEAAEEVGARSLIGSCRREEAYGLMNACDCYVSLHRAEGLGFTLAEAMLMGKPVIGTAYSGNLDFMRPGNSLLVDFERVPIVEDLPFYPQGAVWAEPSVEQAAERMCWVYEHPDQARDLGSIGQREVSEYLSLVKAGRRMRARLKELRTARSGAA